MSLIAEPDTAAKSTSSDSSSKKEINDEEVGEELTDSSKAQSRRISFDLLSRQIAHCGEYTYQALNKIGKLSPQDTSRITQKYLKALTTVEKGTPFPDALYYLVTEGWKKNEVEARDVTLEITKALIRYSKTKVSHLAFLHQTKTPINFFGSFPAVSKICTPPEAPSIQSREKNFFTFPSINP